MFEVQSIRTHFVEGRRTKVPEAILLAISRRSPGPVRNATARSRACAYTELARERVRSDIEPPLDTRPPRASAGGDVPQARPRPSRDLHSSSAPWRAHGGHRRRTRPLSTTPRVRRRYATVTVPRVVERPTTDWPRVPERVTAPTSCRPSGRRSCTVRNHHQRSGPVYRLRSPSHVIGGGAR